MVLHDTDRWRRSARCSPATSASAERDGVAGGASKPQPGRFVAQEKVDVATTPVLRDQSVVPGTVVVPGAGSWPPARA